MGTTALDITAKMGNTAALEDKQAQEVSTDNPSQADSEQAQQDAQLTDDEKNALIDIRKQYKEAFRPKRNIFVRRALRAFEVLKNNPYILYNETTADYDSMAMILSGTAGKEDIDLYQYQDNIYQMLCLAFIASLSNDNPKINYMPVDAQNEEDRIIAKKATIIHSYNERQNGIEGLNQLELMYLWLTGSYFTYTRHVIDQNRAGLNRQPIIEMQDQQVLPDRFICPQCGSVVPEDQLHPFGTPTCPDCGAKLSQSDWRQGESMPLPVKVGEEEIPNGMTAFNVYSGLNVDADPDAQELYDSPMLDLEVELQTATVRSQFPALYQQLQEGNGGDPNDDFSKRARETVTSPAGVRVLGKNRGTYSRCWIQPEGFSILDDENMANRLKQKFPQGVKLVTWCGDLFLQAVPERMMSHWSWCPTLKGLGLYPFGAGDAALDIQARINDCANVVHAYIDRLAFGTILADADIIDIDAFDQKSLIPGNLTGVTRKDADGIAQRIPLEDLMYQPQFHIDSNIFQYEPNMIQLAQVISGVQPQIFGGSDPNVQTAKGQNQALQTATGRLLLFLKRIREERAVRAKNSVQCSVDNMDDEMRLVMNGEVEGDYRTETMLRNELTGDFLAYPDDEEGFPSTYEEIQNRLVQLLTEGAKSPFLNALLSDPDIQRVVARYMLPQEIELPGDAAQARIKILLQQLSQQKPSAQPGPVGPNGQPTTIVLPSIMPNPAFDDLQQAVILSKKWCNQNWQLPESGPQGQAGFNNVLAFLKVVSQMSMKQQIQMQLAAQAAAGPEQGKPAPQPGQ